MSQRHLGIVDGATVRATPTPGADSHDERASVLLVHDEPFAVRALTNGLEQEGWHVMLARTGEDALGALRRRLPSLVVVAAQLERQSGTDLCRAIRSDSSVPVVVVSRDDDELEIVLALEAGADGFVVLPCGVRELSARLRSVVRRCTPDDAAPVEVPADATHIAVGDIELDTQRHELHVRGELVSVPRKQFALLAFLMRNAGRAMHRDTLMDEVWGDDWFGGTKTLESHIKRLRAVIEVNPAQPQLLLTIRGIGYKFSDRRPAIALAR